jgi:hypothetical protein
MKPTKSPTAIPVSILEYELPANALKIVIFIQFNDSFI